MRFLFFIGLLCAALHSSAQGIQQDLSFAGAAISRTMSALAESNLTPEANHRKMKILFLGQSITAGQGSDQFKWTKDLQEFLQQQYPYQPFDFQVEAYGGFTADLLRPTLKFNAIPFQPDLIVLHAYGTAEDYEMLLNDLRRSTFAEIMVMNHHVQQYNLVEDDHFSTVELPALCIKYGAQLIDIRTPWKQYLEMHQLLPTDLLSDYIHPNDRGYRLLAEIIKPHFTISPHLKVDPLEELTEMVLGEDLNFEDSILTFSFHGSALELLVDRSMSGGTFKVWIDQQLVGDIPDTYGWTKPELPHWSFPWGGGFIGLNSESALQQEDWALEITAWQSAEDFSFKVTGSKTGDDGTGNCKETFISNSKRLVISPSDWFMVAPVSAGSPINVGDVIRWKSKCFGQSVVRINTDEEGAAVPIAQGLKDQAHTVQVQHVDGQQEVIKAFRAYRTVFPEVRFSLNIDDQVLECAADFEGEIFVDVEANTPWVVSTMEDWISVKRIEQDKLAIVLEGVNHQLNARKGEIKVQAFGHAPVLISLTQLGLPSSSSSTKPHCTVSPNPASSTLSVQSARPIMEVRMLNLQGRQVLKKAVGKKQDTLDVSALADGQYLVQLVFRDHTQTSKLMVFHQ